MIFPDPLFRARSSWRIAFGNGHDSLAAEHLADQEVRPPKYPAMDALAAHQYDHDQNEPDPEHPVLRRNGLKQLLQHLEHDRADQPAIEIAGAADDEHQHQ